jgi:hypothetical protein
MIRLPDNFYLKSVQNLIKIGQTIRLLCRNKDQRMLWQSREKWKTKNSLRSLEYRSCIRVLFTFSAILLCWPTCFKARTFKYFKIFGGCWLLQKGVFYAINLQNAYLKSMVNFFKLKFVCKGLFGRQRNCLVVRGVQNPAKFTVISSWKFSCYF